MLVEYIRHVGLLAVYRKVRSRLAEVGRNKKVAAVGTGFVINGPTGGPSVGERVAFFAYSHAEDSELVTVDSRFVLVLEAESESQPSDEIEAYVERLLEYAAWSPYSGIEVDENGVKEALAHSVRLVGTEKLPAPAREQRPQACLSRIESKRRIRRDQRASAVLFGLGNYAKTQILPHIERYMRLECIHEIDPDQLVGFSVQDVILDTCPWPRRNEKYDVWFIAGYHHTHASLAVSALKSGAWAVVEKPLAVTMCDWSALSGALGNASEARVFVCFHKRYSVLHQWALADLAAKGGEPIDMHCIVYEIPLNRRHWYNWPNSGTRLVSNGCHWLDYFLFVNRYSPVRESAVWIGRQDTLLVRSILANGAVLTMSLTDRGSERLGVRDYIELRSGAVTVRMRDSSYYESEDSRRVIRKGRVNPLDAYRRMYSSICRRIVAGGPADTRASLLSSLWTVELDEFLRRNHPKSREVSVRFRDC